MTEGAPDDPALALYNQGAALLASGEIDGAAERFAAALDLEPRFVEAWFNLALIRHRRQRLDEAATLYRHCILLAPGFAAAHTNLGAVLTALGQDEQALISFETAASLLPDDVGALANLAVSLLAAGRLEAAVPAFEAVLAHRPDDPAIHHRLGIALAHDGDPEAALPHLERARDDRPDDPLVLTDLAGALSRLGRLDAAEALDRKALAIDPDAAPALINLGVTLHEMARFDEALDCYEKAQALWPLSPPARYNAAATRLLTGDFERGWPLYEARRRFGPAPPGPVWDGSQPLQGRTILVEAEQGLGDTIQFMRYLSLVADRGATVLFRPTAALAPLLAGFDERIRPFEGEAPSHDFHAHLLSLPLAFGTGLDTIPATIPYLRASTDRRVFWRARLDCEPGAKIGLVWAGNPRHPNDRARSMPFTALAPLLDLPGIRLVSLQKDIRASDRAAYDAADILKTGEALGDLDDTAALVAELDLVITVDTSIAHLAGALGVKLFLLLATVPDWRWLMDRPDSPWYPQAVLFRQRRRGDWRGPVNMVSQTLARGPETFR